VVLLAGSHSIFNTWKNNVCHLLNVHGVNDVTQTKIRTDKPLVPEPSAFECEMAIEKQKRYKPSGTDQVSAESIQAGSRTMRSEIHKLIILRGIRNKCLNS
jgi:hypothetical protein